jgi:hypothetical protein
VRSITHARTAAVLAVVVALTAGIAGTAQAAKGGKPGTGGTTSITTPTTTTTPEGIKAVHDSVCPAVAEYTSCSSLAVTVSAAGLVGWTASSGPAAGTITYNSSYAMSSASWAQTVAHEVGGHHDAWREIVAKVGEAQAWTDYYDLDYFGELWAEGRYKAIKGTVRDFTRSDGKEAYLDCVGPVAHGYPGNYLTSWGFAAGAAQQSFCQGAATVMSDSLTKVRPA